MVKTEIINAVERYLASLPAFGIHARQAVLFGSFARGFGDRDSDIDLVVIAPEFDGNPEIALVKKLWRAASRSDNRIEPIPCGERQWVEDDSRAIIEIARREGQRIAAEGSPQPAGA